jgi:hypothetical protein
MQQLLWPGVFFPDLGRPHRFPCLEPQFRTLSDQEALIYEISALA